MEFMREWVMQVAGVIILGTVCDLIMIEGEIKKYVRPIFGLILILSIVRPITALSSEKFESFPSGYDRLSAQRITQNIEKKDLEIVRRLYVKKLEEKATEELKTKTKNDFSVSVTVKEDMESFGEIKSICVTGHSEKFKDSEIKKILAEKFGIEENLVNIKSY